MQITSKTRTTVTVDVEFDDGEQPEVVKPFTTKWVRLARITVKFSSDGDERLYAVGQRVKGDGSLGATESLGEFGIDPRRGLPESLRAAYEAARERAYV